MKLKIYIPNFYLLILFTLLIVNVNKVFSQVSATLLHQNPYQLKIEDFFRLNVINYTTHTEFDFDVVVSTKGSVVYKAGVKKVIFPKGSSSFEFKNIQVINETFPTNKHIQNLQNFRQLTTGEYEICYYFKTNQADEILGENCESREVTTMTPILLNLPEQNSTVNTFNPMLLWLPPTPIQNENNTYQIKLAEILPNQSPFEALNRNPSLLKLEVQNALYLVYPNNAIQLQNHQSYAWQVINPNNRKVDSEIWQFTVNLDSLKLDEKIVLNENYIIPTDLGNLSNLNIKNQLKVMINEPNKVENLELTILDINQNKIDLIDLNVLVYQGNNKFIIDLSKIVSLRNKNYYQVILKSPTAKNPYKIFFRYFRD
jgi:hypothetical protein